MSRGGCLNLLAFGCEVLNPLIVWQIPDVTDEPPKTPNIVRAAQKIVFFLVQKLSAPLPAPIKNAFERISMTPPPP